MCIDTNESLQKPTTILPLGILFLFVCTLKAIILVNRCILWLELYTQCSYDNQSYD